MKLQVKKTDLHIFALLLILFIYSSYYFVFIFAEKYSYPFVDVDVSFLRFFISFLFFIVFIFIGSKLKDGLYFIFHSLLIYVYIFNSILFSFSNGRTDVYSSIIVFFFIIFLIFRYVKIVQKKKIKLSFNKSYINERIIPITIVLLFIPYFLVFGVDVNINTLLLAEVYDVRFGVEDQKSAYFRYTDGLLAKFLLPYLLVYSIKNRNYGFVVFSLGLLLYIYMIFALKTVYFTIAVTIFLYIYSRDFKYQIKAILSYLLLGLLLLRIFTLISDFDVLESLIIRRNFFVPAILNQYYFDFFDGNSMYLSHSIFSSLFDYPYENFPQYIIAERYWGQPEVSANNGIIGDAFMNFGYLGIAVYSFLFALVCVIMTKIIRNPLYSGILFVFIVLIITSSFTTIFLTHGLFVFLMVFWVFKFDLNNGK